MSKWILKNPEDFKRLNGASIETFDNIYSARIWPDNIYFTPTLTSSLRQAKKLVREEWQDQIHKGKRMKWEQAE